MCALLKRCSRVGMVDKYLSFTFAGVSPTYFSSLILALNTCIYTYKHLPFFLSGDGKKGTCFRMRSSTCMNVLVRMDTYVIPYLSIYLSICSVG